MRAVAQRLLNVDEGCPVNQKYLLKELLVIRELSRLESADVGKSLIGALAIPPSSAAEIKIFELCKNEAFLLYQKVGQLLNPWDRSWTDNIKSLEKRNREIKLELGGDSVDEQQIVSLVKKYEEYKEKRKNESN